MNKTSIRFSGVSDITSMFINSFFKSSTGFANVKFRAILARNRVNTGRGLNSTASYIMPNQSIAQRVRVSKLPNFNLSAGQ